RRLRGMRRAPAEHTGDRIPDQHASGDAERRLRSAGEKSAAAATIVGVAIEAFLLPIPGPAPFQRPPAAHEAAKRAATALLDLAFELADAALGDLERVLLHQDRLRHVVGSGRLTRDQLADEGRRLGIPRLAAPLDV